MHCKGSGGWSKGGDGKPFQLYKISEDRGEQNNLVDKDPKRTEAMRQALLDVIAQGRTTSGPKQANDVPVNP
jgi:hypothetical protein